ncbi:hypothetical protein BST26_20550 [Mycolicibacterium insubricum]|uniref:Uncharacterized protein n=1 Tax=Mycolicibacterium insubricum TaxID=444597 RepID=A0A1X0CSW9_9MYCO|nr:hypothetical protein BST26_20550 [Mycolicibacterium insubricum]
MPTDQPDQPENGSADEVQAEEGKAAEPKPGDPEYDWTQHYPDGTELFRYTFPGGPTVALKAFGTIYSKTWLYKLRDIESDFEVEFAAIDRAICPTGRSLLMELDDANGDPIDDLWNAWIKAGTSRGGEDEGLTPGNSKSSPAQ